MKRVLADTIHLDDDNRRFFTDRPYRQDDIEWDAVKDHDGNLYSIILRIPYDQAMVLDSHPEHIDYLISSISDKIGVANDRNAFVVSGVRELKHQPTEMVIKMMFNDDQRDYDADLETIRLFDNNRKTRRSKLLKLTNWVLGKSAKTGNLVRKIIAGMIMSAGLIIPSFCMAPGLLSQTDTSVQIADAIGALIILILSSILSALIAMASAFAVYPIIGRHMVMSYPVRNGIVLADMMPIKNHNPFKIGGKNMDKNVRKIMDLYGVDDMEYDVLNHPGSFFTVIRFKKPIPRFDDLSFLQVEALMQSQWAERKFDDTVENNILDVNDLAMNYKVDNDSPFTDDEDGPSASGASAARRVTVVSSYEHDDKIIEAGEDMLTEHIETMIRSVGSSIPIDPYKNDLAKIRSNVDDEIRLSALRSMNAELEKISQIIDYARTMGFDVDDKIRDSIKDLNTISRKMNVSSI
jgi:hypothetical protein